MPLADSFSTCENLSFREFRYNLHWLPVAQRTDFKILTYVHKIVYNPNVSLYFKSIVILQYKYNQTRSENKWKSKLPKIKNSYGLRDFSFLFFFTHTMYS